MKTKWFVLAVAMLTFALLPLLAAFAVERPSFQFFEQPAIQAEVIDFQLFPTVEAPVQARAKTQPVMVTIPQITFASQPRYQWVRVCYPNGGCRMEYRLVQ
jgi:hypothetical protein